MAASAFEQFTLELINRFRLDPRGAFDRIVRDAATGRAADPDTTQALAFFNVDLDRLEQELDALAPAAPLAWNDSLAGAATDHTRAMLEAGRQSHQLAGEPALPDRVKAAGYDYALLAENVFAAARSAANAHDAFVVDWGAGPGGMQSPRGHRDALIEPGFAEIGIGALGVADRAPGDVGPWLVTHNIGARAATGPFLLGAVYDDADGDGFYAPGEGRGGATVEISGRGAAGAAASGGWALETGQGRFGVTLDGPAVAGRIAAEIDVARVNAKLDLRDGAHLAVSADLHLIAGAASVTALGAGDVALRGKHGGDRLIGNPGDNRLSGEGGDDALVGRGGGDTLRGGGGDDRVWGGPGRDALYGGSGDDALGGGPGRDRLEGGAGDDRLWGGGRGDVIEGGGGADALVGGGGWDALRGGAGADRLFGGPGRDQLAGGSGRDALGGGSGPDRLVGGAHDDRLWGGDGDDVLEGGPGSDTLTGGRDRDRLQGGPGADALFGGPGDDRLSGGPGDDRLWGGGGRDVFVFSTASGRDRILDWEDGDAIDLRGSGAEPGSAALSREGDDAVFAVAGAEIVVVGAAGAAGPDDLLA